MFKIYSLFGCGVLLILLFSSCGEDSVSPSPNKQPVINSVTVNPTNVFTNQSTTVTVDADDPDGDQLTYTYIATGGTVSGSGSTATFLAGNTAGSASITVTVSDGEATATGQVSLTLTEMAPNIAVSAQEVGSAGGGTCLVFTGVPGENIIVVSVQVSNPINQSQTYNFGSLTVISGQPFALQDPTSCYTKRSGVYNFTFTGNRPGGGPFTATASYTQP